jgi:hypothetical protein
VLLLCFRPSLDKRSQIFYTKEQLSETSDMLLFFINDTHAAFCLRACDNQSISLRRAKTSHATTAAGIDK